MQGRGGTVAGGCVLGLGDFGEGCLESFDGGTLSEEVRAENPLYGRDVGLRD